METRIQSVVCGHNWMIKLLQTLLFIFLICSQFSKGSIIFNYLVDNNNPTGYSQVVEEFNRNGILERNYHIGHQRFAMSDHVNGGDISYYSFDGHGSIRGLTNESGDVIEEYDFDSYGILIGFRKDSGSGLVEEDPNSLGVISRNEFLFAGEQWDADMGMYYNRARWMSPEDGRFHSMDTWEGRRGSNVTLNKYLYGNGNPVSYVDPSGNFSIVSVAVRATALVGLTAIGNITNIIIAGNNIAEAQTPDAAIVSLGGGFRTRGFGAGAVTNFLYFFNTEKMYVYSGGAAGLEPISFFGSRRSLTTNIALGLVYNISSPNEWSGFGFSSTFPPRFAKHLGRILAGKNGAHGALLQLARLESSTRSSNLAIQVANSTSGASAISIASKSSTFATDVGWLGQPIDVNSLASQAGTYLSDTISKVKSEALRIRDNFGNSIDRLNQ